MNACLLQSHRRHEGEPEAVLDLLARSETPAFATDRHGHIVFWNRAAERVFGRTSGQVRGRRCCDVMGGRDAFGNRFCHENCAVLAMTASGENVGAFEIAILGAPRREPVTVTVVRVPGSRPGELRLVHLIQPIDQQGRRARALELLGARVETRPPAPAETAGRGPVAFAKAPAPTERKREILRLAVAGLRNQEIAQELGLSVATVRNHVHNILEEVDVHEERL